MPFETGPEAEICSTCRRPLTQRGSDGECLRCLFGIALSVDDPLPEDQGNHSPVTASTEAHRYGHFEILTAADGGLQELGAGAMGVTYRAQDSVLRRVVALKVIARSFAGDPATQARFLREARAAAQLRHPNVASVFHYGEQDSQCFYAMELVEGETLEARVRRDGPLPAALALEVAAQVTRALAAAEAQGVIHRDLKPGNIMLAADGPVGPEETTIMVKVIDFGLAKAAATGAESPGLADTRGGFVGTPAFASPEQYARGQDERVDTRSDIYSLGVTLWYLLCGRLPFVGGTLSEIQEQQTRQPLPLHQLQTAQVPAPVMTLLKSMLAVSPADRPQSARELLTALGRCQRELPAGSQVISSRRWFGWIGTLAILMAAGSIVGFWRLHPSKPNLPRDRSLAVLPFENRSSDQAAAYFTDGMYQEITKSLAQIAELKVIDADSTRGYPPGKRELARIGPELGVGYLLEGSVERKGDHGRIAVKLSDVRGVADTWTKQYDLRLADVSAVQREITHDVAVQLGAKLSTGELANLNERPTNDPVAYDLFLRAEEGLHQFESPAELIQSYKTRVALLEEAVKHDPNFALAYCGIAHYHDEILFNQFGAPPEGQEVDHKALAEAALEKARQLKPDMGEVHLALAKHYLTITRENEKARIEVEMARRTLPNDGELEQITGLIARSQGRWDDAAHALERACELAPREPSNPGTLAVLYRGMRRYGDADRASARLLTLEPVRQSRYDRIFRALGPLEQRADLAPLRALLAEPVTNDTDDEFQSLFEVLLTLLDHNADAVSHTLAVAKTPRFVHQRFVYPKAWFEGLASRMRGDRSGAQAAFTSARTEVADLVQSDPGNARMVSLLGLIDAGLGRGEEAVREGRQAYDLAHQQQSAPTLPIVGCNLAAIYAWTGHLNDAFVLLDELAGQAAGFNLCFQVTYGDLRLNPIWDPLRADPRFASLVLRLSPPATK